MFIFFCRYILKNDSLFFNVEGANDGAIVSKYIPHFITIKPNLPVILKNKRFLLKVTQTN